MMRGGGAGGGVGCVVGERACSVPREGERKKGNEEGHESVEIVLSSGPTQKLGKSPGDSYKLSCMC